MHALRTGLRSTRPVFAALEPALLLVAVLAIPRPVDAAPFIVGNGTAASCTQAAVQNAIIAAAGSTIRFRCGQAPVTIALTGNQQDPNWGLVALIPASNTTIDGGGLVTFMRDDGISLLIRPGITVVLKNLSIVTGDHVQFPYFHAVVNLGTLNVNTVTLRDNVFNAIENDGTLTIRNSVISGNGLGSPLPAPIVNNGVSTIDHSSVIDNTGSDGVILNTGTLSVKNSVFSGNVAETGGAIANYGAMTAYNCEFSYNGFGFAGGAISNQGQSMLVKYSTFEGNRASEFGGAIWGGGTIQASQFLDNVAGKDGGALRGDGGVVTGSTFLGNYAGLSGGAIMGSALTIRNSTLAGNVSDGNGGALYGGPTLRLFDSTVTANAAALDGGGIYATGGIAPSLIRTQVAGNTPNDIVVRP